MGSEQRYIEVHDFYELSDNANYNLTDLFDDYDFQKAITLLSFVKYPGEGVYDTCVINMGLERFIIAKVYGSSQGVNVIYSVHMVEDVDVVLDHINVNKYVDNIL